MKTIRKLLSITLTLALLAGMSASGILNVNTNAADAQTYTYVKVETAPANWSGKYLIVYEGETGSKYFNGNLDTLNTTQNGVSTTIIHKTITGNHTAFAFTIAKVDGGYTIQSPLGYYIGRDTKGNGMHVSKETAYVNQISLNPDGSTAIQGAGGYYLNYDKTSGSERFRYYNNTQEPIALYLEVIETAIEPELPSADYIVPGVRAIVLEKMLYMRYYFTLSEKAAGATECGIEYWSSQPEINAETGEASIAPETVKGCGQDSSGYYVCSGGISAACMTDTQYYRIYVIVDGSTYYTEVRSFSLQSYYDAAIAQGVFTSTSYEAKLVTAAIAYGNAAKDWQNNK